LRTRILSRSMGDSCFTGFFDDLRRAAMVEPPATPPLGTGIGADNDIAAIVSSQLAVGRVKVGRVVWSGAVYRCARCLSDSSDGLVYVEVRKY